MAKTSSGVYQLPNGMWGFRYAFWIDGKQKDIKRTTDENGNPFKTERAAIKAREAAMIKAHMERTQKPKAYEALRTLEIDTLTGWYKLRQ